MYRVEQVLIPVDFSSFSRSALEFAKNLSPATDGQGRPRLQLVHAVAPMAPYVRKILFPYAALGEDDREFEAEIVESAQTEMARYFGLEESLEKRFINAPVVEFGHAKERVPHWASRFAVDLIAVGAFGEGGVFAGGLGATARRLLSIATQPVALIRDFEPSPRIRSILVAVDLGKQTPELLRVAVGLALQQNARLELLFVLPSPFLYDTNNILKKAIDYKQDQIVKSTRGRINAHFERAVDAVELPFGAREARKKHLQNLTVLSGDPAKEIAKTAYEGGFDLVVVGANNRQTPGQRSLGRVAEQVAVEAGTHVMVVPASREKTPLVEAEE